MNNELKHCSCVGVARMIRGSYEHCSDLWLYCYTKWSRCGKSTKMFGEIIHMALEKSYV